MESIIGIISGLICIITTIIAIFQYCKGRSLTELMKQLAVKGRTQKEYQKILRKMNKKLLLDGITISKNYIQNYALTDKGKEAIFMDICEKNNIEPTTKLCKQLLGTDMPRFRQQFTTKKVQESVSETKHSVNLENEAINVETVYLSELLKTKYPSTCADLIEILEKHNVKYDFLKGTKDIWCRDYMPIQTRTGKFIQFRYDPSYLKGNKEWKDSRSDVKEVCRLNNIDAQFSDINIDGGNVLLFDDRAILSDRIFSENLNWDKESLINEISNLLECEIIIIPAQKGDVTGHADGMVRFVNRNTILGNKLADEYKYCQKGIQKVIETYNLKYIDMPFITNIKDSKYPESAMGIYVNYLEVNNLIILPIFDRYEDKQVIEILKKTFPEKTIETINYNRVAQEGGLLNCTTWVIKR